MTGKSFEEMRERVDDVRSRIAAAAKKAGKRPEEICLVGVTKTQSAQRVAMLLACGVRVIGENRVQEMLEKRPALEQYSPEIHIIGHLQRNKAKYLPGNIQMLQSLDSVELVEALERAYGKYPGKLDVLIEINIGDETSKTGIRPELLPALAHRVAESPSLRLRGLMAIPPLCRGREICGYFEQMNKLFIDIKGQKIDNNIDTLSMGMSADYEYAIEEGATMVRVGSGLFGPRGA